MSISATFAIIWIAFTAGSILLALPILVWAVRSGQFSGGDRARRLPLRGGRPKTGAARHNGAPNGEDGDVLP